MKTLFAALAVAAGFTVPAAAAPLIVYSNDFDTAATVAPGTTVVTSLAGGAIETNTRTGNYLRNATAGVTTFTLSGLTAHDSIDFDLSVFFVDSWDGSGISSVSPDFLFLSIDGSDVTQLSVNNFANSEFTVPGGTQVGTVADFAGSSSFGDRQASLNGAGYLSFAHSASSITFGIRAGGSGFQYGSDESWGLDHLVVTVNAIPGGGGAGAVPEPATWGLMVLGFGMVGMAARRRRKAVFA